MAVAPAFPFAGCLRTAGGAPLAVDGYWSQGGGLKIRFPEKNKKQGLCYVATDDGIELPVIDVMHAAFSDQPSPGQVERLLDETVHGAERWRKVPRPVRWLFTQLVLRRGMLTRGVVRSRGAYLDGLSTYLARLGPENLGAYAKPIDRKIAATLPALAARVRLRNTARLLADGVARALQAQATRPLLFLNIAGGPAADSFNALLLLRREHPAWLAGRAISILVLDIDPAGPAFGRRAVQALMSTGGPLGGLQLGFDHAVYDWAAPGELAKQLAGKRDAFAACSSEGGLLEYGADEAVLGNLQTLREGTAEDAIFVASVPRIDGSRRILHETAGAALHLRTLREIESLCERAGWRLARVVDGPLNHCVSLVKS
jgi:hypothetical protein